MEVQVKKRRQKLAEVLNGGYMECPRCHSVKIRLTGKTVAQTQRFRCIVCNKTWCASGRRAGRPRKDDVQLHEVAHEVAHETVHGTVQQVAE